MTERTAEVIVVGGGVIGCSIAFHLTRLGVKDVLVLEKGTVAGQASGRSGALVRMHYSNEPEARLALAALPWFERWKELVGGDCGFVPTGFLQLVHPSDNDKLRQNTAMLQRIGVQTRLVAAEEIQELQPGLEVREDEIGAFEPRSGYADPVRTTCGFAAAAQRRGAMVQEGVEVTGLLARHGRIEGVETGAGLIWAPRVVLASGGWSPALARPLGIDLPITPARVQLAIVQRPATIPAGPAGHRAIIDRRFGFYTRPWGENGTLVGLSSYHGRLDHLDAYPQENDAAFIPLARQHLSQRFPSYAAAAYLRGHAGPLDVTSDGRAILGQAPGVEGLYLAVGMSGSGFKKAPAIGACLAELITEGAARTAPLHAFRTTRFAEGEPIQGVEYDLPASARDYGQIASFRGRGFIH
jgi:sarcosine oxidase subunit beta